MKLKKDILIPYIFAIACLNVFFMGIIVFITWVIATAASLPFDTDHLWESYWLCYALLFAFNIKHIIEE